MAPGFVVGGVGRGGARSGGISGHGGLCRVLPGVMLFVERTIGLPDGKDQVEKLAHAVSHGNVTSFALGPEAAIEGADRWVMAHGDAGGIPEVAAHQIVAFARHVHRAGGQGVALPVDPRAVFLGKDAEIADDLVGRGEAVDVHDLADYGGGRGLSNARDGEDLDMGRGGQFGKGGGQQFPQAPLGVLAVTELGHKIADQCLSHGTAERGD